MYCKYHTDKQAYSRCAGCGVGLCDNCSRAIILGEYYCHSCSLRISDSSKNLKWKLLKYTFFAAIAAILAIVVASLLRL